jgi:hypothetical protein
VSPVATGKKGICVKNIVGRQEVPFTHKLLFHYSRKGFKGSERLWKFATKFVAFPDQCAEVYLPDGFMMEFDNLD